MKLATKISLIMMLGIAAVLSFQAVLHVRRVLTLHRSEVQDDLAILGRTLGSAVTEIWMTAGEERARAYVQSADSRRERTRINLVHYDDPSLPQDLRGKLARSRRPRVRRVGDNRLVAYTRVEPEGDPPSVLRLSRQLTDERAYIRGVIWSQSLTTVILIVISTVLAMLLGLRLVGRRVEELIAQSRRVGRGEFAPNEERGRDELGLLAHEMNLMSDQLQQSKAMAWRERQARTALLEQLRHSDRLSTIGRLASSIAHELGTPLNVVSGRAELIASGQNEGQEAVESASIISTQTARMAEIIRQLLDFSRGHVQREVTPISAIINEAVTLLEPLAEKNNVSISCADLPAIEAAVDAGKVLQVLTNLMMNAIQAMPQGGRLGINIREVQVDEPGDIHAIAGHYVCLEVEDQGMGISADGVERIFEPFFTTKGEGEGTGLGLPVCHGIVREHGGWIAVDSTRGKGSRFSVYLPKEPT